MQCIHHVRAHTELQRKVGELDTRDKESMSFMHLHYMVCSRPSPLAIFKRSDIYVSVGVGVSKDALDRLST